MCEHVYMHMCVSKYDASVLPPSLVKSSSAFCSKRLLLSILTIPDSLSENIQSNVPD